MREKYGSCELCGRKQELSFHHLIPRTTHSNKWFKKNYDRKEMENRGLNLCRDCHLQIHKLYSEKELGRKYNTLEKLLQDHEVKKYLQWIQKR